MNARKFPVLLFALVFSSLALAENKFHEKKPIPILTSGANGFAYMVENSDGIGGTLHLAKIIRTFPVIKAKDLAVLENYDTGEYMTYDLGTSPDNKYLVSYELQSFSGEFTDVYERSGFPDEMDIRFYDMSTGEYLGYVDDIPYGYLNKSLHPSESLEEYQQSQLEAGVPPEVVAEYDYSVNNEHSYLDFYDLQWNTDGTVSVSYFHNVYLRSSQVGYIGSEIFTINYTVNPSGVALESYGNIKTPAAWPSVFDLAVEEPLPGNMQLESQDILFPQKVSLFPWLELTLPLPKKGARIVGSIPARYWNF